jgi:hypothetical protein
MTGIVINGDDGTVTTKIVEGILVLGIIITEGDDGSIITELYGIAGTMNVDGNDGGNTVGVTITNVGLLGNGTNDVIVYGSNVTGTTTGELQYGGMVTVGGII